ncbi:hypothetical protein AK812_SmicGene11852 [Symbiodinium microadriaticum]|uniref:Uncharacterized protein n=1 Tax=Symbiodinium microadriaticum TaxID=2951 RepID=A0A1Q9EC58_SYMMI|nr:hypothetical protein AK812_SmicGene11852 [Symbiodinium microadriaticum]
MDTPLGQALASCSTSAQWSTLDAVLRKVNAKCGTNAVNARDFDQFLQSVGSEQLRLHGVWRHSFGPKYKPLLVVNPAYARTVARDPEAACSCPAGQGQTSTERIEFQSGPDPRSKILPGLSTPDSRCTHIFGAYLIGFDALGTMLNNVQRALKMTIGKNGEWSSEATQLFLKQLAKRKRIVKAIPQAILDAPLAIEDANGVKNQSQVMDPGYAAEHNHNDDDKAVEHNQDDDDDSDESDLDDGSSTSSSSEASVERKKQLIRYFNSQAYNAGRHSHEASGHVASCAQWQPPTTGHLHSWRRAFDDFLESGSPLDSSHTGRTVMEEDSAASPSSCGGGAQSTANLVSSHLDEALYSALARQSSTPQGAASVGSGDPGVALAAAAVVSEVTQPAKAGT